MQKKSEDKTGESYSFKGKRILLVEDHPMNIMIVQRSLVEKGLFVEVAENGKIAVDMFLQSQSGYYHLILMDIRMPVMDGIQATERIRNSRHTDAKQIPIIAMTANCYEEDKEETKTVGMNAHLVKPVSTWELCQMIEKWILQ